jgi:transaldolase
VDRCAPPNGRAVIETSAAAVAPALSRLRVKIFADGADTAAILALAQNPYVKGFTTNPTLMHKAGIRDYERFARELLAEIPEYPVSFEVFADDNAEMLRQAREIATWGTNVYVKIPVTNTKAETTVPVIRALTAEGTKVNVTALMTVAQTAVVCDALSGGAPANVSIFAGRIADTGRDPLPIMRDALAIVAQHPGVELIWASPRELLNIFHADSIGTHIITVTHDLLAKLALVGKDLDEFSLDTVKMFANDAAKAGFTL